jgi:hypothetical protein
MRLVPAGSADKKLGNDFANRSECENLMSVRQNRQQF